MAATTNTTAALKERSGVGVKNSITKTGIKKMRANVMTLGGSATPDRPLSRLPARDSCLPYPSLTHRSRS